MVAEEQAHIGVSEELAELGCPSAWGDALELAAGPCKKKVGEEERAHGLAWASCGMKGWRESMEDASLVMPVGYLGGSWRDAALFGVFDGHGGEQVARFAARRLPCALAELDAGNPEAALAGAFRRIDEQLREPSVAAELRELTLPGNEPRDSAEHCGTTAVCCLVRGSELVVANAGDSRAVLCRRGKAVALTEDHKPELPKEEARIEAAGGFVQEEALSGGRGIGYRVNGDLNLSRALGDLKYKDPSKPAHEHMVSGVPDTQTLSWTAGDDDFVLLACDGVWECMDSQEAVNFVRTRLPPPGPKRRLLPVLEALLDACCANHPMQRGGLGCDNVTAVLIRFEDPQAVAAAAAAGGEEEEEERPSEGPCRSQLEAALSQTIQRLSSRRRLKETPEEREEREAQQRQAREEEEARAREELERQELRKRRREERERQGRKEKKRVFCCAAEESEEGGEDDEGSGE